MILFFKKQREIRTISLKIEIYSPDNPSTNFLYKNAFKYLFYYLVLNCFICRKLLKVIDQSLRFQTQFDNMKTIYLYEDSKMNKNCLLLLLSGSFSVIVMETPKCFTNFGCGNVNVLSNVSEDLSSALF